MKSLSLFLYSWPITEDLDIFGESYEIEASSEYGFRQRSNTAVRLEKLRSDRMAQKKCKRIQWKGEAYMEFPGEFFIFTLKFLDQKEHHQIFSP